VKRGKARENTAIQWVAALIPALSALPSAYFVARSSWYWLILNWHVEFWPALGIGMAFVIGLVVEGLGIVSVFLALTFWRWNSIKAKVKGYDRAPLELAISAVVVYVAATVALLAVLEAWGDRLGPYAPMVFPFLTIVGGLCWAMYDQHRDRLAEKGLSWNWVAEKLPEPVATLPQPVATRYGTWQEFKMAYPDMATMSGNEVAALASVPGDAAERCWHPGEPDPHAGEHRSACEIDAAQDAGAQPPGGVDGVHGWPFSAVQRI
jgi:hypothetical protein